MSAYWGFCDRLVNTKTVGENTYKGPFSKEEDEYTSCWQKWNGARTQNQSNDKKPYCNNQRKCNFWIGDNNNEKAGYWWKDDDFKDYNTTENWGNNNEQNCNITKKKGS